LRITIQDQASYEECLKKLEARLIGRDKGAKQVILAKAAKRCETIKKSLMAAWDQVEQFSLQYQGVLKTKEKIIQLNIERFLSSGRKILDAGWAKNNLCPFCGSEVDFDHLREELNRRLEEV